MKLNKKTFLAIVLLSVVILGGCVDGNFRKSSGYGVFLGLEPKETHALKGYKTIVIDADYFTPEDIKALRAQGNEKVYSYLNIGSVENFRDYYHKFEGITIGDYESWPEERWVDVSQKSWQDHVLEKGKELSDKGVDGFFLDNASVYYYYERPQIYEGLLIMLKELNTLQKPLVINGGDVFVTKALEEKKLQGLISGVNQETVFTSINFDNNTYHKQDNENREYYLEYLKLCKAHNLKVYLLEYGYDKALAGKIEAYCAENNCEYFISKGLELKG